jgi:hypothetical protein
MDNDDATRSNGELPAALPRLDHDRRYRISPPPP